MGFADFVEAQHPFMRSAGKVFAESLECGLDDQ
jgi:hypothetical protein